MTFEPPPLTDEELERLVHLLAGRSNPVVRDLLTFAGAETAAGLMTRLVIAEGPEPAILVAAVRRALENARR